jgi:hypothetical protein
MLHLRIRGQEVHMQPLQKYQLASFLTFAHHLRDCPDDVKAITEKYEGDPWTAKLADDIRASVSSTFKQILKDASSKQVS